MHDRILLKGLIRIRFFRIGQLCDFRIQIRFLKRLGSGSGFIESPDRPHSALNNASLLHSAVRVSDPDPVKKIKQERVLTSGSISNIPSGYSHFRMFQFFIGSDHDPVRLRPDPRLDKKNPH